MKDITKIVLGLLILAGVTACTPTETGPRPFLGNADAPVLIEEFSDLQCPACASISPKVEQLVRDNPDLARFEYYHFPLPQHQNAFPSAEAAECAADQGKFFEFIDLAFANQNNLTEDGLKAMAAQLGLDQEAFDDCFDGGAKKGRVRSDRAEGLRRNVNSTPSLFVNGSLVRFGSLEQFEAYLRSLAN